MNADRRSFAPQLCFAVWLICVVPAPCQEGIQEIPPHFTLDMQTAARLRPQLMAGSVAVPRRYAKAQFVFERLLGHVTGPSTARLAWQIRMIEDEGANAYSSPDGGIYVERGLAEIADASSGLWAAILAHEIAHVLHRHWAQRYLFEKALLRDQGASLALGDPGFVSGSWANADKNSADLAHFCRQLEFEADREALMLMSRAGYHPDFVPALHHLLHAHGSGTLNTSVYAMHPCWEERDQELSRAYNEASIAFERLWPEWYASPGGNPPVLVFANQPSVKKIDAGRWEIRLPMRCQNLAGAVEVVVRADSSTRNITQVGRLSEAADSGRELRQLTGCTSPTTTISFAVATPAASHNSQTRWTDIYILDAWGMVLARADLPKIPH